LFVAGIFDLKSPADLLAKLGRELERLRAAPNDADHAFNFFITAEHMLDWLHPGKAGRARRESERKKQPLLQLVSHLANGAKHFDRLSEHHQSAATTGRFVRPPINPTMQRIFPPELTIVAGGPAGKALGGSRITALALAESVYEYWKQAPR
jgi:hypothetical protein